MIHADQAKAHLGFPKGEAKAATRELKATHAELASAQRRLDKALIRVAAAEVKARAVGDAHDAFVEMLKALKVKRSQGES